jgi:hypothetical protein
MRRKKWHADSFPGLAVVIDFTSRLTGFGQRMSILTLVKYKFSPACELINGVECSPLGGRILPQYLRIHTYPNEAMRGSRADASPVRAELVFKHDLVKM